MVSNHNGDTGLTDWLAGVAAGGPAIPAPGIGLDDNIDESGLDVRTHALVRLAALVGAGESAAAYDRHIAAAVNHSVTPNKIINILITLLPTMNTSRINEAAPAVLGAIGRVAADLPAAPRSAQGPH